MAGSFEVLKEFSTNLTVPDMVGDGSISWAGEIYLPRVGIELKSIEFYYTPSENMFNLFGIKTDGSSLSMYYDSTGNGNGWYDDRYRLVDFRGDINTNDSNGLAGNFMTNAYVLSPALNFISVKAPETLLYSDFPYFTGNDLYFQADTNYKLPETSDDIFVEGATISSWDPANGRLALSNKTSSEILVGMDGIPSITPKVTLNLNNVTKVSGPEQISYNQYGSFKFKPLNDSYMLPDDVTVSGSYTNKTWAKSTGTLMVYGVTSDITISITAVSAPETYMLTYSKDPGVYQLTVTVESGYGGYGTSGTLSSGATIYEGAVLKVYAVAAEGYLLANNSTSYTTTYTVDSDIDFHIQAKKYYNLILDYDSAAIQTFTVTKTSGFGTLGALTNGSKIFEGDVLSVFVKPNSGYYIDSNSYQTQYTVGNSNLTISPIALQIPTQYKLTIIKGTGVKSVTVTKTSGYGITGGELTTGSFIYHGDSLSVVAEAEDHYRLDTYTTNYLVTGDVSINITATRLPKRAIELDPDRTWNAVSSQDISLSNPINFYADDDPIMIEFSANTHYIIKSISVVPQSVSESLTEGSDYSRSITSDGKTGTVIIYPECDKSIFLWVEGQQVTYSVKFTDSNNKIKLISPTTVTAGSEDNIQVIFEIADENGNISDYGFPTTVGSSNINGATFVSWREE